MWSTDLETGDPNHSTYLIFSIRLATTMRSQHRMNANANSPNSPTSVLLIRCVIPLAQPWVLHREGECSRHRRCILRMRRLLWTMKSMESFVVQRPRSRPYPLPLCDSIVEKSTGFIIHTVIARRRFSFFFFRRLVVLNWCLYASFFS